MGLTTKGTIGAQTAKTLDQCVEEIQAMGISVDDYLLTRVEVVAPQRRGLSGRDVEGFAWVDANDADQSVLSFIRRGTRGDDLLLFVLNFTPVPRHNYRLGVPRPGHWAEVLNGDAPLYGGSGQGNIGGVATAPVWSHGHPQSLNLTLPPLAMLILRAPRG